MRSFDSIMAAIEHDGEGWRAHGPARWMQGRTLYGGLSAAIALRACELQVPDLPPLRSAQIAFIGPVPQDLRVQATVLRRGRSVTYMAADILDEGKVVLRALFAFGAARQSQFGAVAPSAPDCPAPADCPEFLNGNRVSFMQNIDQLQAGELLPLSGAPRGDLMLWVRHKQPVSPGMAALVALGDALPPGCFTRFTEPVTLSSATWSFDLLEPERVTGVGWHLLRSVDDNIADGYSMQQMSMWGEDGRAILQGRQAVAIFG